jgi:heme/copper-type cytochrome/quinol oxidase subunit 3
MRVFSGDTGATTVALGIWLFIALEIVLFGSLFSVYALARSSADQWPLGREILQPSLAFLNTFVLLGATASIWRARDRNPLHAMGPLAASTFLAFAFLVVRGGEYRLDLAAGLRPTVSMFLALYFTLTGLHALHVLAGGIASAWVIAATRRVQPALTTGRIRALSLYWLFVDAIWIILLLLFYLT